MGKTLPAARLKPFALKFFFSNQYLYAHVQRRADGVVRFAAPRRLRSLAVRAPTLTPRRAYAADRRSRVHHRESAAGNDEEPHRPCGG